MYVCIIQRDGLNPRLECQSHGKSKVKPTKTRILLRWVTFLALDLWCTLPHVLHPIIVELYRQTVYFQPTMWGPFGLALKEISISWLICLHSKCLLSKGRNSLHWPFNSYIAHLGITWWLRPGQEPSNTIIHDGGNIIVVFYFPIIQHSHCTTSCLCVLICLLSDLSII